MVNQIYQTRLNIKEIKLKKSIYELSLQFNLIPSPIRVYYVEWIMDTEERKSLSENKIKCP